MSGAKRILGSIHTVAKHLSQTRYFQLLRYFHVSDPYKSPNVPLEDEENAPEPVVKHQWWHKLEPMVSTLRSNFEYHWKPGSNVSIDEMMVRFFGRSKHTQKMPNKPIKQGYKMWALCEAGYLYSFMWNSRTEGIGELEKQPDLTPTASMVLQLAKRLHPLDPGNTYTIYLDNYFTSIPLFSRLRCHGFGACGTTRPHNSGSRYPAALEVMKEHVDKLPWGTLFAVPVDDVLCLGWIDNNIVNVLSTVHTVHRAYDHVITERKRPADSSTNAKTTRKPFGEAVKANLPIPRFINDYNYFMGGVDLADQHRQAYETQRRANRNWIALFCWALDHTIINAFKLGVVKKGWTKRQHHEFRVRLWQELFTFSTKAKRDRLSSSLQPCIQPQNSHERVELYFKDKTCQWCSYTSKSAKLAPRSSKAPERNFGTEISGNMTPRRPKRTRYGCNTCAVPLCNGPCFDLWHQTYCTAPQTLQTPCRS